MTATPAQALTEIALLFTTVYPATPLQLPNMEHVAPVDAGVLWASLELEHTSMAQGSLADNNGVRRYENDGIGTLGLRFKLGDGIKYPYEVADDVASLYRGKRTPSDVWFRNVTIIERPDDRTRHYRLDVVFDFTYDQIS